ncbi:hypothetical protein STAFG_0478 [Streptomyces afghaniensis 772]|uniref:Uncharacterized protein n=1 Tax=Streptomyces afghaniensis 772 TaxID=1283301 RepID=S4MZ25_9ACTN|nr:hypothetical protein STAFG_0478 [Streptomyces afghaniensis 772]
MWAGPRVAHQRVNPARGSGAAAARDSACRPNPECRTSGAV